MTFQLSMVEQYVMISQEQEVKIEKNTQEDEQDDKNQTIYTKRHPIALLK